MISNFDLCLGASREWDSILDTECMSFLSNAHIKEDKWISFHSIIKAGILVTNLQGTSRCHHGGKEYVLTGHYTSLIRIL